MTQARELSKIDLMYEIIYNPKFAPMASPNASIRSMVERGGTIHLMHNQRTGLYYILDGTSNTVWQLIDGKRTVHQILDEAQTSLGKNDPDAVTGSLLFFAENGLLTSADTPVAKKRIKAVSPFTTTLTLLWNGTRMFTAVHRIIRPLLHTLSFWLCMSIILVGVAIFSPRFGQIFQDARNFQILDSTVVGFLFYNFVVLAPVIALHEFSHGVAMVHYGRRAGEVGTGLLYFGPMFYVDTVDYWSLPRRQRIMIMWAGNLATLLVGSTITIVRFAFLLPSGPGLFLDLAAFWCFYSTLWNLTPLFETDGYHIMADVLKIPFLRDDSFSYLKNTILRTFRRPFQELGFAREKRILLFVYAILSSVFLAYLLFATARFTMFMAADATSWTLKLGGGIFSGTLGLFTFAVGATSIVYFALTMSGYGVLVGNQLRKTFARGQRFDAIHDRQLAVFCYVPTLQGAHLTRKLQAETRGAARSLTSNFTVNSRGGLNHAILRMGSAAIPLQRFRSDFRRVENKFYRVYQRLVFGKELSATGYLGRVSSGQGSMTQLLWDMAGASSLVERSQIKSSLKEFLNRQETTIHYLLLSTFGTVWTLEVPPAEQDQLFDNLLPTLLVDDITTTDLIGDLEEFKSRTIYGLDSIARLASETFEQHEKGLARPEKHQVVSSFEPVRGRILFVGRTESVVEEIAQLGPLLMIQVWAGFVDNILADTSLKLSSIFQTIPTSTPDLSSLSDGEIRALNRYVTNLERIKQDTEQTLSKVQGFVRPSKQTVKNLRKIFESKGEKVGLLRSILALNQENLESIPDGVREVRRLSAECFSYNKSLKDNLKSELTRRDQAYLVKKNRLARYMLPLGLVSVGTLLIGLIQFGTWLSSAFIATAAVLLLTYGGTHYLSWRSTRTLQHYPTPLFGKILSSNYALALTIGSFLSGASVLDLSEILEDEQKDNGREVSKSLAEKPAKLPEKLSIPA